MRIVVVQDYKENRAKCTLTPLDGKLGISFLRLGHPARSSRTVEVGSGVLLHLDGAPLARSDSALLRQGSLFMIDSTWARVAKVLDRLEVLPGAELVKRSLPAGFFTAYPRASKLYKDPESGLASVEALFAATAVLEEPRFDFLASYRWAREFLERNAAIIARICGGPDISCALPSVPS